MDEAGERLHTGGCQCGRVRYRARIAGDAAYLCHCRMCQRATGGFAAAFVAVDSAAVTWEGEPAWYESSAIARRGFCAACGTPLAFAYNQHGVAEGENTADMDLTLGSFDTPGGFVPVAHYGAESLHAAWLDTRALPRRTSAETPSVAGHWRAAGLTVP